MENSTIEHFEREIFDRKVFDGSRVRWFEHEGIVTGVANCYRGAVTVDFSVHIKWDDPQVDISYIEDNAGEKSYFMSSVGFSAKELTYFVGDQWLSFSDVMKR